jgi:hypothetical protein
VLPLTRLERIDELGATVPRTLEHRLGSVRSMSGQEIRETPLAWSQSGDAFDVPDAAVLWRVRRLSGNLKGGAPELVYGADGLPLMVDITIGPAEFMEAVDGKPGKYRLDALDEMRKAVPAVPAAYFVVSSTVTARAERHEPATSDVAVRTLAEAFKHQSERMGDVFKLHAEQLIGLIAEFRQVLAEKATRPELPPAAAPATSLRNGSVDPDDVDEEDEDDDELEDEQEDDEEGPAAPPREPDLFDRVQGFCAVVPADNLRVVGQIVSEHGPKVLGDAVRTVIKEGIAGFMTNNDGTSDGGGS